LAILKIIYPLTCLISDFDFSDTKYALIYLYRFSLFSTPYYFISLSGDLALFLSLLYLAKTLALYSFQVIATFSPLDKYPYFTYQS
jgi:hypothetical protein